MRSQPNFKMSVDPGDGLTGPVLLVTTCWWPSLARFAHLLTMADCQVSVLCPPGHSVRAVPGVQVFDQQALRPMRALSAAIAACQPAMIIPADDRAVSNLHRLHRTGSEVERRLIERSLGSPDGYSVTTSRTRLIALARRLGIPVPEDKPIATVAELHDWIAHVPGPWVLKVDGAWAGVGVRIAATPKQAEAAFRRFCRWFNGPVALKRLLVNRDPFSMADWLGGQRPEVSAQRYIRGRPGNLIMFCRDGKILAATSAEAVASWGETGPSTIIRLVDRPDFLAGAARLALHLGLTGFYGMDFVVEQTTGQALLIELNPRVTALANIRLNPACDLIAAAATKLSGVPCPPPSVLPSGDLVAHFPLAWHWNREDPRLASCFQDVPWNEPALMAEMLRPSWPDRPLLARAASGARRLFRRHSGGVRLAGAPSPALPSDSQPCRS
jgi:hypothetical protein